MLRLILGISGVGLILLGMFGEGPLENAYNRVASLSDSSVAVELPAVANKTDVEQTSSPASIDQAVVEQPEVEVVASDIEADTNAVAVTPASVVSSDSADQLATDDTSDDLIAIGDEVIATAADQAPVSELSTVTDVAATTATTDEQKASARNDQVELAQTILTSTGQAEVSEDVSVDKAEEVEKLLAAGSVDAETDVLIVVKDRVNLRQGPSIDHPVVLQLEQGQELMEFKREGRWVHVGAYGTSGKIGWVHQRLVGPAE